MTFRDKLNGKFAIREAITNHRTTSNDITLFVKEVVRIGSEVTSIGHRAR